MATADRLLRDLSYALRSLRRTPAFTVTAILILGLGIGMASTMFTVFEQILIKRLPVQNQEQLVELSGVGAGAGREIPLSLDQYKQFAADNRTLESVAAFGHWGAPPSAVMDGDRLFSVRRAVVTGNFLRYSAQDPIWGGSSAPKTRPITVRSDQILASWSL